MNLCMYLTIQTNLTSYICTESLSSIRMEFKIECNLKIAFILTWARKAMAIFIHQTHQIDVKVICYCSQVVLFNVPDTC